MSLLPVPHVCAVVHTLMVAAPQSLSQHSMFPTPRSVDEHVGDQYASPDGFRKYTSFEGYPNVEGLIITHGSPRNHIWSFATGVSKNYNHRATCPCSPPILASIHLQLSEKTTSASLGTVGHLDADGTLPIGAYTLHFSIVVVVCICSYV